MVPGSHTTALTAPAVQAEPAGHVLQLVCCAASWKVPASHNMPTAEPVGQYAPRGHGEGVCVAAPQKKLKRSMESHSVAPLTGPCRHFINEVEIHPGYYVDWDDTPDETIVPLANAYGEYLTRLFEERRKVGTPSASVEVGHE